MTEQELRLVSEIASKNAVDTIKKLERQDSNEKKDRRLHNTRALLRNYRSLKKHCEKSVQKLNKISDEDVSFLFTANITLESVKQSTARTRLILLQVDTMLAIFKKICRENGEEEKFDMLISCYVDHIPIADLADKYRLSGRSVQRYVHQGIKTLSILLFGVDSLNG